MTFLEKWRHAPYKWHALFIGIILVPLLIILAPFILITIFPSLATWAALTIIWLVGLILSGASLAWGAFQIDNQPDDLASAVISGRLDIVKWLVVEAPVGRRVIPDQDTLRLAVGAGRLGVVKCLIADGGITPDQDTLKLAVIRGHLGIVKWLMAAERGNQQVNPTQDTLDFAVMKDHLDIVQWLMAAERGNQQVNPTQDTLDFAVMKDHLDIVQWLMAAERGNQQVNPTQRTLEIAVMKGHLNIVKYLEAIIRNNQQTSHAMLPDEKRKPGSPASSSVSVLPNNGLFFRRTVVQAPSSPDFDNSSHPV